MNNFVKI